LERVHRIGNDRNEPRNIVAKFSNYKDCEAVRGKISEGIISFHILAVSTRNHGATQKISPCNEGGMKSAKGCVHLIQQAT